MNKGVYGLPKSRTYESGYKVYTALINQVSTDPPTAIVLENTIGPIWWSYISTGKYQINSDRLFPIKLGLYNTIRSWWNRQSNNRNKSISINSNNIKYLYK